MIWRTVLCAVVVFLCVSCTSAISGQAGPDSAAPAIPPRPRELRINGVDPCRVLTLDQVKALHVTFLGRDAPIEKRGPGCQWDHSSPEPIEGYTVAINTDGGVELAFGHLPLDVLTIAGFGAVETPAVFSTGKNNCVIHVDVATRQALQVGYFYTGATVPMTHEIACAKVRTAAEMAMKTVLAELGG